MSRFIPVILMSVAFTAVGLVCGYMAGGKGIGASEPPGAQDAGHEAEAEDAPVFSAVTLKNLGVRVDRAKLTTFSRYLAIPAVVTSTPRTRQTVFAPAAGRVQAVNAVFGAVVPCGRVVATVIRDPIPRAELALTRHVIEPASETLHATTTAYQKAVVAVEIQEAELKRLEAFSGEGGEQSIIPGAQLIQVRYELKRAQRELSSLRHKLLLHGLTPEQVEAVEQGHFPVIDAKICLGALEHNGLWTPLAAAIYAELPADLRAFPWTVATIGEIVGGGFVRQDFVDWLKEEKSATRHFLEIGGLVQRGHSLADLKNHFELGAFDTVVQVKAPGLAPDWDVEALLVKPGGHVEEGQPLMTLKNARELTLRVEPSGGEVEVLLDALKAGTRVVARSLVPGAAPPLDGLAILKVFYPETGRAEAYVPVENAPLVTRQAGEGRVFRSWQLGEGQRYMVRVPTEVMDRVYVLPVEAVAEDGPDKVVFLQSGDHFRPVQVEILYQDDEVVVIPATADFFPGNPIVTHGAFALGLALKAAGGGAGGGHGHDHVH